MVLVINCNENPFELFVCDVWRGLSVDEWEGAMAAGRDGRGNTPWGPLVVFHNRTTL